YMYYQFYSSYLSGYLIIRRTPFSKLFPYTTLFRSPGDEAVADIVQAAAAVFGGDGGAQQTELTHLTEDRRVGLLVTEGIEHPRHQLVLAVLGRRVADHTLFFGELLVEQQRVCPVETCFAVSHENSVCRS